MKDWARDHLVILGGIGVGIAVIQVGYSDRRFILIPKIILNKYLFVR